MNVDGSGRLTLLEKYSPRGIGTDRDTIHLKVTREYSESGAFTEQTIYYRQGETPDANNEVPYRIVTDEYPPPGATSQSITRREYRDTWADGERESKFLLHPKCFIAGTPILMADGTEKPIEQILIGDRVLAFKPIGKDATRPLVAATVTRTFARERQRIWRLGDDALGVTPGHVFFDGDDGQERQLWLIAARGGSLIDSHGRKHRVQMRRLTESWHLAEAPAAHLSQPSASRIHVDAAMHDAPSHELLFDEEEPHVDQRSTVYISDLGEVQTVYNFEVDDFHTYVAGGWRTHNDSEDGRELGAALGSYIGSTLLSIWGVDNVAVKIGVGAVTTRLGAWIGESLYHGLAGEPISNPLTFFNNFGGSLITSAVTLGVDVRTVTWNGLP